MTDPSTKTDHGCACRQRLERPQCSTRRPRRRCRHTKTRGLSAEEVRNLPVTIDLLTASRALGIGRTKAYQLARTGQFPCRVWRVGRSYRVRTTDLQTFLGMETARRSRRSASRRKDR